MTNELRDRVAYHFDSTLFTSLAFHSLSILWNCLQVLFATATFQSGFGYLTFIFKIGHELDKIGHSSRSNFHLIHSIESQVPYVAAITWGNAAGILLCYYDFNSICTDYD